MDVAILLERMTSVIEFLSIMEDMYPFKIHAPLPGTTQESDGVLQILTVKAPGRDVIALNGTTKRVTK